jgi:hypothetical protein
MRRQQRQPVDYEPAAVSDTALLFMDVQPATADSSELVVYGRDLRRLDRERLPLYVDPNSRASAPRRITWPRRPRRSRPA